jgi:hypothetical protein
MQVHNTQDTVLGCHQQPQGHRLVAKHRSSCGGPVQGCGGQGTTAAAVSASRNKISGTRQQCAPLSAHSHSALSSTERCASYYSYTPKPQATYSCSSMCQALPGHACMQRMQQVCFPSQNWFAHLSQAGANIQHPVCRSCDANGTHSASTRHLPDQQQHRR